MTALRSWSSANWSRVKAPIWASSILRPQTSIASSRLGGGWRHAMLSCHAVTRVKSMYLDYKNKAQWVCRSQPLMPSVRRVVTHKARVGNQCWPWEHSYGGPVPTLRGILFEHVVMTCTWCGKLCIVYICNIPTNMCPNVFYTEIIRQIIYIFSNYTPYIIPHTWYLPAQSLITLLKLIWRE